MVKIKIIEDSRFVRSPPVDQTRTGNPVPTYQKGTIERSVIHPIPAFAIRTMKKSKHTAITYLNF